MNRVTGPGEESCAFDEVPFDSAWVLRLNSHARRLEAPLPKAAGAARKRQKGPASVNPIIDEDVPTSPSSEAAAAPDAPWCTVGKNVEAMWEKEWWQAGWLASALVSVLGQGGGTGAARGGLVSARRGQL